MIGMFFNSQTAVKTICSGKSYQKEESPIPPTVKYITDDYDKQILPFEWFEYKPMKQKYGREEN